MRGVVVMLSACAAFLAAPAWAAPGAAIYRNGATHDRVLAIDPQGVTHAPSAEFEVHDGLGVIYVRHGSSCFARLVSPELAARVYSDTAPLGAPDGKITSGDAWVARLGSVAGPSPVTSTERLLLSSARRILYEALPAATWFGRDQLSSLTVESDPAGALVGRRTYGAFGAAGAVEGDADRRGFTAQEADATGMLRFRFRQLDPLVGHWSSPDPLFAATTRKSLGRLGESTTAYAYVANNAANFRDPSGLGKTPAAVSNVREVLKAGQILKKMPKGPRGDRWGELQSQLAGLKRKSKSYYGFGDRKFPGSTGRTIGDVLDTALDSPFQESLYYETQVAVKALLGEVVGEAGRKFFDLGLFLANEIGPATDELHYQVEFERSEYKKLRRELRDYDKKMDIPGTRGTRPTGISENFVVNTVEAAINTFFILLEALSGY